MGLAGTCCLRARPVLGGGAFAGRQATRFRPLALAAAMLHVLASLPLLLLLAMPAPTHAWSRPLWYQVGLDLQPWGCQPKSMEGCRGGLSCPGYWLGPGASRIYPVAGVMITTTMLMICRKILQGRRCSQATKGEVSAALSPPQPLPPCTPSELSSTQPCPMGPHWPVGLPHSHPQLTAHCPCVHTPSWNPCPPPTASTLPPALPFRTLALIQPLRAP